jgi:hypothetical protein
MKKILAIVLVLVFVLSLCGCANEKVSSNTESFVDNGSTVSDETIESEEVNSQETESEEQTSFETDDSKKESEPTNTSSKVKSDKRIKKIVDESHKYLKTGNIVKFYEKDFFNAYFTVSGENDGIIVYFEDGTTMGVVEAFEKKQVTLADLDKFGVKYIKGYSRSFFDLTEYYDCDIENKTQEFYRDENFSYTFPTEKADYVKYVDKNGKTWIAGDALRAGKIKHYDLGNWIDFDKKYIGNKLLIVNESEGYFTLDSFEEFYRDETYIYYFPDVRVVVVYYPDGTSQDVTDALKDGKIKVTDLKKFGITYYTNADLKK